MLKMVIDVGCSMEDCARTRYYHSYASFAVGDLDTY